MGAECIHGAVKHGGWVVALCEGRDVGAWPAPPSVLLHLIHIGVGGVCHVGY
jgi:hypothetical protein